MILAEKIDHPHPYPYIRAAWAITRAFPDLRASWHTEIHNLCTQKRVQRLNDVELNRCCYWWLARTLGYREIA